MKVELTAAAIDALEDAPQAVRKAFHKQVELLL